jgi:hypothetical protein
MVSHAPNSVRVLALNALPPGGVAVGAGAGVRVGRVDAGVGRMGWEPGGAGVGGRVLHSFPLELNLSNSRTRL